MAKNKRPVARHGDEDEQVRQAPKPDYKNTPFGEEAKEQNDPLSQETIDYAAKKNAEAEEHLGEKQEPQPKGTARTVDPALPVKEEEADFVLMEFPFDLNLQQQAGKGILRFKKGTQKVPADLADHIYFEKAGVKRV